MWALRIVIAAVIAMLSAPASASLVLTYDSPRLEVPAGGSVQIGATLTNVADGLGPLQIFTDADGHTGLSLLRVLRYDPLESTVFGNPARFVAQFTTFDMSDPHPLTNLDLTPGASFHLDLGILTVDSNLPVGEYLVDIGIYADCPNGFSCLITPFDPPNFADAGFFRLVVTVPEPGSFALLGTALFGLLRISARRQVG